jgi:hypothetical protein
MPSSHASPAQALRQSQRPTVAGRGRSAGSVRLSKAQCVGAANLAVLLRRAPILLL